MIDTLKTDIKIYLEEEYFKKYQEKINFVVEEPKKSGLGDISIPVFVISKVLKKPLPVCSEELIEVIKSSKLNNVIDKLEIMGGFLNIHVDRLKISKTIVNSLLNTKSFGESMIGENKTVCIDYSSPNIAKPFSIGHLRSTIIGHAIGNILEKCSYKVVRINHLGDFGTQFGKVIYAYKNWLDEDALKKEPINELLRLYAKFHIEEKETPEINDEARRIFKELERGNEEYFKLWSWIREESLKEFMKTYDLLKVSFDSYNGEAFYNDKMNSVVLELENKNLLKEDQGAMIVDLGEDIPPALIKKTDGSTLYITRDLAAVFYRKNTYNFDQVLYVVGNEQKMHFEQLSRVIDKMGYDFSQDIKHINFGLVLQNGKKMSTRKGKIVKLIDVIKEAVDMSYKHIEEKNPSLENKELVAEKIGVSAVIFNDLKNYRTNDFEFDLEGMIKFEGQTGPYLQYTSVRINSILNNVEFNKDLEIDNSLFAVDHYFELIKLLGLYKVVLEKSASDYAPSVLAKYLLNLASVFNSFYSKEKIIVDDLIERNTKLTLIYLVREVLNDGMNLLGMQIIEKM